MEAGTHEGQRRYAAFLSYSHKDAATARAIHRRLETYRIPRRLVGSDGERGPVPARLTPVFRDREELPAAGDLSEKVRAALAASDALIVLCSPAAAASLWVAKEIDTFRALHPGRPVIAAILEGEPAEAFPANLAAAGAEPLAADLRPGRDGRRLGLLKLVAGLSGIPLDALVQRDAQRRLRRVTAVTGVALAAVVAMAVLTAVALTARTEAQRQRAEAEGLVEFMLTDLRDRLKGVGRLDVLTAVNQRALEHYGSEQALTKLAPDELERRARILHAIGEDDLTTGDLPSALHAFEEAKRTTAENLKRSPSDANRIYAQAQSEYWIGQYHYLRREWAAAAPFFLRYERAARRLFQMLPNDPRSGMELGYAVTNLGNLRLNGAHDPGGAATLYLQATQWFARAAALQPGNPHPLNEQANAFAWLADAHSARGLSREARDARRRQYDILISIGQRDPNNQETVFRLTTAERALGIAEMRIGERERARQFLFSGFRRAGTLIARDPQNAEWLLLRSFIQCDLLFTGLGHPPGVAATELRRSVIGAAATMRSKGNPREAELGRCLAAIQQSK